MSCFEVFGPLPIARAHRLCATDQTPFWTAANAATRGLAGAIGCYVFALQQGARLVPWFVGSTLDDFGSAVFQPAQTAIYDRCMSGGTGAPVLFLLPLCTANARNFSGARKTGGGAIGWLEQGLMGLMFARSAKLASADGLRAFGRADVPEHLVPNTLARPFRALAPVV